MAITRPRPRRNVNRPPQEGNCCAFCKYLEPSCKLEQIGASSVRFEPGNFKCILTRTGKHGHEPACYKFQLSYEADRYAQ